MSFDLDQHTTFTMLRPRFDTKRAWFQAVCGCGFKFTPTYNKTDQVRLAERHLARAYDEACKSAIYAWPRSARGRFDIAAWRAANPLPAQRWS